MFFLPAGMGSHGCSQGSGHSEIVFFMKSSSGIKKVFSRNRPRAPFPRAPAIFYTLPAVGPWRSGTSCRGNKDSCRAMQGM